MKNATEAMKESRIHDFLGSVRKIMKRRNFLLYEISSA